MLNYIKVVPLVQVLVIVILTGVHGYGFNSIQFSGKFYKDFTFSVPRNPSKTIKIFASSNSGAALKCGRTCASNVQCQAFNLRNNGTYYFCEMLPANMWVNQNQIAYVAQPGAVIWEKQFGNGLKPFIDEKLLGVAPANYCETIRPGCNGTWPACSDCVKSCIDCYTRYNKTNKFTCTMWPGPTVEENTPIITTCWNKLTHLVRRRVNITTGEITDNHILPFRDMNRLCKLNVYSLLQFVYNYVGGWYQSFYSNPYISENGTLMNLRFSSSKDNAPGDGLSLGTGTLPPAPFVSVNDDKYSCGSFWLLDSNNATYCPGGGVSFFGTPTLNALGQVNDSGIHWPLAKTQGKVLNYMDLALFIV